MGYPAKAAQAAHIQNYQGVFIYQSGPVIKSVQITHANNPHGEFSHILILDGTPREILSQGNDAVIYNAQREKVVIEKRPRQNIFPAILPPDLNTLKATYLARKGGMERVGGREAVIVFLDPRDQYRYGYKFWADREYGLLLRSLMTDLRNEALEQITFNQIAFLDKVNMDWFHPKFDPSKQYCMEDADAPNKTMNEANWTVKDIPPGFRKIDQTTRQVPGKSTPVTHTVYSDGLAAVSLFIEPLAKGARPSIGQWVKGSTRIQSSFTSNYQITVVGEVPEATTARIANAVRLNQ